MKPKPFSPLNHFTEPVAIENPLLPWPDLTVLGSWPVTLTSQRDFQICNGGALADHNSAPGCPNGSLVRKSPQVAQKSDSALEAVLPPRHQAFGRRQDIAFADHLGHLVPVGL